MSETENYPQDVNHQRNLILRSAETRETRLEREKTFLSHRIVLHQLGLAKDRREKKFLSVCQKGEVKNESGQRNNFSVNSII